MNSMSDVDLAQVLLDYHRLRQVIGHADCIIALGSSDPRVADRAAELFQEGRAPLLVVTGNCGALTKGMYETTEAEAFAKIARERGVPESCILLEKRATNTGENVRFSRELLESNRLAIHSAIAVQKPYMERRTLATFQRVWPELDVRVTSPQLSFEELTLPWLPQRRVIEVIVGDLQRIVEYPKLGFQTAQPVPPEVMAAFEVLVARGYTGHLMKQEQARSEETQR